jgi:hypothetical protein
VRIEIGTDSAYITASRRDTFVFLCGLTSCHYDGRKEIKKVAFHFFNLKSDFNHGVSVVIAA